MRKCRTLLAFGSMLLIGTNAVAADQSHVMVHATRMLEQMANDPNGVPIALLRQSEGVILVPNLLNAGFLFGAKIGRGVFLVRDGKGRWGNPVAVIVSGGSFGLQAGAQSTESVMVFRSKSTVVRLLAGKSKITLGVDAGIAAGPIGTKVGAETDLGMRAEILSYSKSRGIYAGAALGGAGLNIDRETDAIYYDAFGLSTFQIIEGDGVAVPIEAARLKAALTMLTNPPPPPPPVEIDEDGREIPVDPRVSKSSRTTRPVEKTARKPQARRPRPTEVDDLDLDPEPVEAPQPKRMRPIRRSAPPADDSLDLPAPKSIRSTPAPVRDTPPGSGEPPR